MASCRKVCVYVVIVIAAILASSILYYGIQGFNGGFNIFPNSSRPNIVVIIADDVGWNDFSLHGSNQIPTPNIDALGHNGIILHRFYTQSICTPSRTAFLTGNYPIRAGLQGFPIKAGEDRFIPLDMPIISEHLKRLGYRTHLVGKWHQGSATRRNTPTGRGFDTHFGYWNGFVGYFDYFAMQRIPNRNNFVGLDLFDQFTPVWSAQGKYATDLFTDRSLEIIDRHDIDEPLFLVLAHLAGHTGTNGTELGVPDIRETNRKYDYIKDPQRRRYADIVNIMDQSVGKIVKKLSDKNILDNSIILFFSDNGAQTIGMYQNWGSNWPLRGLKFNEFEGGVRGTATIFSPLFKKTQYVNTELIHISDWLPTFYAAAGGNLTDLGKIDGINQWETLSENKPTHRSEILININEVEHFSAIITENGKFKLVNGSNTVENYEEYYGEDGRGPEVPPYDVSATLNSDVNLAICKTTAACLQESEIKIMRQHIDLSTCRPNNLTTQISCKDSPCLFDLEDDPCETRNIVEHNQELVEEMLGRLLNYEKELVPQTNRPADLAADPVNYNNTWCTWLDDDVCFKTKQIKVA